MKNTNIKAIKEAINSELDSIPNKEISFGVYASCGRKYVTITNCHNKTTQQKIPIECFEGVLSGLEFSECYYNWLEKCES